MSTPSLLSVDEQTPKNTISEGFTEGGDLILRTLDGIDFHVHSVILSLASPVLASMFSIGTQRDAVNMGETSEVLALMLSFIYPRPPRPIASFDVLRHGLHVADKYQLDDMTRQLRDQLSLSGSPVSVFTEPLCALAFATAHDFQEEAKLAASHASKEYNFQKIEDLMKLIEVIPSVSPFVQMIGTPSARTAILFDVLFNFHQAPITLAGDVCANFLCPKCTPVYLNNKRRSPPEWLARWSYWVFTELNKRPLSDCPDLFTVGFLNFALHRDRLEPILEAACACPSRIGRHQNEFESWAGGVYEQLKKRLQEVDKFGSGR